MDETEDKNLQSESLKPLLEQLLSSKSERLVIKPNDKGKNRSMWSHFDMAHLDGKEQHYACCKYCKGFVKYTGRTGTGGLMRHFCYKQFLNQQDEKEAQAPAAPTTTTTTLSPPQTPTLQDPDQIPLRLQLETLIAQKSPRIGYIYNYKGKSGVWSQFYMITLDSAVVNFACCIACHGIVKYVSRTGTGSMTRHKCQNNSSYRKFVKNLEHEELKPSARKKRKFSHEGSEEDEDDPLDLKPEENWEDKQIKEEVEDEEAVDEEVIPQVEEGVPKETENLIRAKHVAFVKKSFDVLEMFQNEQFLDFAQTLVDLGAEHGKFDLRKILKGRKDFRDLCIFKRTE